MNLSSSWPNKNITSKRFFLIFSIVGLVPSLDDKISKFKDNLKETNLKLWDIEDGKRLAEKNNLFDENFIELARNVYKLNDIRAKIKLEINNYLGSNIKEVKSYE